MNNFKMKALVSLVTLASFGAQASIFINPDFATKVSSEGTFSTDDRCLFTNVAAAVMAYDGEGNWIVTKVGTIDIEAKGQKVVSISAVGTLIESESDATVDSAIEYVYDVAKNATVANADNITGVASKITTDFTVSAISATSVLMSSETETGSQEFDLTTKFTTQFELGGYAKVDKTKVKEEVKYVIQHDVECVQ